MAYSTTFCDIFSWNFSLIMNILPWIVPVKFIPVHIFFSSSQNFKPIQDFNLILWCNLYIFLFLHIEYSFCLLFAESFPKFCSPWIVICITMSPHTMFEFPSYAKIQPNWLCIIPCLCISWCGNVLLTIRFLVVVKYTSCCYHE